LHTTKVYSGVGADIVMESIALRDPFISSRRASAAHIRRHAHRPKGRSRNRRRL